MKPTEHVAAHVNGLKSSLHAVEVQLTILKQLLGETKKTKSREVNTEEEDENEEEELEASDDQDDNETEESNDSEETEETDESEEEDKPAKKASGKVTAEQVNDACKARLQKLIKVKKMTSKKAFQTVKDMLQEHFDTDSVAQIAKEDRAKALKILSAPVK